MKWLNPARYGEAAAVVFCDRIEPYDGRAAWSNDLGAAALKDYFRSGGIVVFTGQTWETLSTNAAPEIFDALSFPEPSGEKFLEKTVFESGRIYCCTQSIIALRRYCAKNKISLGDADGEGNWVPSPEGERIDALVKEYEKVFKAIPGTDRRVEHRDWGIKPLGPMGTLNPSSKLRNEPQLTDKRPEYKPGLKVLAPGQAWKTYIVGHKWQKRDNDMWRLAREVACYMKEMSGLEAEVVELDPEKPEKNPYTPREEDVCVFVTDGWLAREYFGIDFDEFPLGTSFLRRKGNWFLIGGNRSGASHALTYLLEAMGCRYLWPSEDGLGKIVPRTEEVVFPEIDWTWTPPIKHREIRVGYPTDKSLKEDTRYEKHGWTATDFMAEWKRYRLDSDAPGTNRDFYAWQGVFDKDSLEGYYHWGHSFTDYYRRYHETNPEFFALQPNGSRDLSKFLTNEKSWSRATLCVSNPELIDTVASNLIVRFGQLRDYKALSISLNDAGGAQQCMCEACRRLDPPNAKQNSVRWSGGSAPYPALTDRVVWFANQIAERVKKVYPDKQLCFYAYNAYCSAPKLYTPDPMLVVLTVVGDYSTGGSATGNFAQWSSFGIPTYWRPNLLWGFRTVAPQNFSRRLFNDIERMKVNNLEGTDFDCYYDQWAEFGLVYYMLSRALMNPDRLDYDTIRDDYLSHAFGPAAPAMAKYYDLLEEHFENCSSNKWTERHGFYSYSRSLDIDALQKCFDEAKALAAGDETILKRIAHFEIGLEPARFEKAIVAAYDQGDREGAKEAQQRFREWTDTVATKHFSSVNPRRYWDSYHTPCFSLRW